MPYHRNLAEHHRKITEQSKTSGAYNPYLTTGEYHSTPDQEPDAGEAHRKFLQRRRLSRALITIGGLSVGGVGYEFWSHIMANKDPAHSPDQTTPLPSNAQQPGKPNTQPDYLKISHQKMANIGSIALSDGTPGTLLAPPGTKDQNHIGQVPGNSEMVLFVHGMEQYGDVTGDVQLIESKTVASLHNYAAEAPTPTANTNAPIQNYVAQILRVSVSADEAAIGNNQPVYIVSTIQQQGGSYEAYVLGPDVSPPQKQIFVGSLLRTKQADLGGPIELSAFSATEIINNP